MLFKINWPSAIGWHKPAYCLVVVNKQGSLFWKTKKKIAKTDEQVNPFFVSIFQKWFPFLFKKRLSAAYLIW